MRENTGLARSPFELDVYKAAFSVQQATFEETKHWPSGERFSLVDQIRRSSRSIGANLAEAWSKRAYPAHFVSKLADADGELQETLHWLATASECGYLGKETHENLETEFKKLGKKLGAMIAKHETFCRPR
jgi:four helix bundle protein